MVSGCVANTEKSYANSKITEYSKVAIEIILHPKLE